MLKTIYATEEEIPEGYKDLYTERNGQWELTGIQGVKTQADVDRVQQALVKERTDHKATKTALQAFGELDPSQVHERLENYESMEQQLEALKAGGAFDEEKMEPIIQSRVRQALGPIEREKTTLQRKLDEANKKITEKDGEVGTLKMTITTGSIERAVSDAAVKAKVLPTAITDAVMRARSVFEITEDNRIITKDNSGSTPGLSPDEWFKEQSEKAPHWWPASVGGGSRGAGGPGSQYSGAANPWSREGWNITKQGQFVREHGEVKATEMAARVGAKLGDTKPPAAAAA